MAGDRLTATIEGAPGTDFDLFLFGPDAVDVASDEVLTGAAGAAYPDTLEFVATGAGTYYLDVWAREGTGSYSVTWSISPGWSVAQGLLAPDADGLDYDLLPVNLTPGDMLTVEVLEGPGWICVWEPDCWDFDTVHGATWWLARHGQVPASLYERSATYVAPGWQEGDYHMQVIDAYPGEYTVAWKVERAARSVRLAGVNRYATAQAVSRSAMPNTPYVVLVSGESYADALSAASLAGYLGGNLLLTRRDELPVETILELARLDATQVKIVGGAGAVSNDVANDLVSLGYKVQRFAGADRYATSAAVANYVMPLSGIRVAYLARGDQFADALAASPISFGHVTPVLLTPPTSLAPSVRSVLTSGRVQTVYPLGGTGAVSDGVLSAVRTTGVTVAPRLAGSNRYGTARAVATHAVSAGWASSQVTGLATGATFPDALAGGPGIGRLGGVLLLTPPTSLAEDTRTWLTANAAGIGALWTLGGSSAVSYATQTSAESAAAME